MNAKKSRKKVLKGHDLFEAKSSFLKNNDMIIFEKISIWDFLELIYVRDDDEGKRAGEVYPFEETMCDEYVEWRRQMQELGPQGVTYKPDQVYRYNAIWMSLQGAGRGKDGKTKLRGESYVVTTDLTPVDKLLGEPHEAIISSPITYVGKRRTARNARYLYALAFDLDGVGMDQIRDLLYQMSGNVIPTANIIVNSGNGLHLYYLLRKPVALFDNAKKILGKIKRHLTRHLWNQYTSTIEQPQYQGIFQGFRVPGSRTKRGEIITAYYNRDCPLHTIEELCRGWVSTGDPGSLVTKEEWTMLDTGKYSSDRNTLRRAKELWPEWYDKVIVRGERATGTYKTHRGLYDWWLRRLRNPLEPVMVGHRYFCLLALAIYAIKAGVSEEELRRDAYSLVEQFDKLTKTDDNHFTEVDAEDAIKAYKEQYCTFPRDSIAHMTGLPIKANKRNGRPQAEHLARARAVQEVDYPNGQWINREGRPVAVPENSKHCAKVREWRYNNPNDTNKSRCARETGLSRPTVHKWWDK